MLTRTTITTDTTDPIDHDLAEDIQDWIDGEVRTYVQKILAGRIKQRFHVTLTACEVN